MGKRGNGHAGDAGKVALYMRVSGEEQARRESIGTQEAFLTDYCKLYGFEIGGVYKDVAVSGTIPVHERPSGFEMLQQAERGAFDTVLLYKLDRIGRKLVVVVDAHDRLEEADVAMRSATEPLDTSNPAGRLIFQMLASFAEFERATIAERVGEGVRRSFKSGKRVGCIPYGYDIAETGEFVVVEEEAARVREIFANIAEGGTLYSEATRLNAEGVPSPGRKYRGKPRKHGDTWGHASIRNFIHQTAYTGAHVVNTARGPVEREVPAIITPELGQAAVARLEENKRYSGGRPKNKYLLRGIIKCGCCNVNYTGFPGRVGNKTKDPYLYVRYACTRWRERYKRGWLHLDCPPVNAAELETLVWDDIRSFAEDPGDALDRAVEQMAERVQADGLEERRESLAKRLAQTQAEKSKYVKLYAQGSLEEEELDVHLADAGNRIANLKLLAESVEADIAHKQQDYIATQDAALWLASLRDGLDALEEDTEEAFLKRRELVKLLVERITVGRAENGQCKIDVVYKFRPPEPGEVAELRAVGNTLGLRTGRKKKRPRRQGGSTAWRASHRTPRPTFGRCWRRSG
jgi:site-specific DNA recombinase